MLLKLKTKLKGQHLGTVRNVSKAVTKGLNTDITRKGYKHSTRNGRGIESIVCVLKKHALKRIT